MQPTDLSPVLQGLVIEGSGGARYRLRELIGEGGQGYVYRASSDDPSLSIVVKVLRPERIAAANRFEREASVLRMLSAVPQPNPYIVKFYDFGRHTLARSGVELPFMVLEHVEGQPLDRLIRAHGGFGLPVTRARALLANVASALHSVHAQGIVHRDLKPSNVLLAQGPQGERAKVTDFGLVKLPSIDRDLTVDVAGASIGYAPPEQYEQGNQRVTLQTDVFAFAAIVFEMLSGSPAFPARPEESPYRVIGRILSGTRRSLTRDSATLARELRHRPDLTRALDREIARATSADPSQRHASIAELWGTLEPLLIEAAKPRTSGFFAIATESTASSMPASLVPLSGLHVAAGPLDDEQLTCAARLADDDIIACGKRGLYRLRGGTWAPLRLPTGFPCANVRGMLGLPTGALCVYGERGLAVWMTPHGDVEPIDLHQESATLLGAHADGDGIVFVGHQAYPSSAGAEEATRGVVIARTPSGLVSRRVLDKTQSLRGATRVGAGQLVVCGTRGDLIAIDDGGERSVPWGRTGHLSSIASSPINDEAFVVGSGGHALRVDASSSLGALSAALEVVQTTQQLTAVVVGADGVAWAVGHSARLLHRKSSVWVRIPLSRLTERDLILVSPGSGSVKILASDGTLIVGRVPTLASTTSPAPARG